MSMRDIFNIEGILMGNILYEKKICHSFNNLDSKAVCLKND